MPCSRRIGARFCFWSCWIEFGSSLKSIFVPLRSKTLSKQTNVERSLLFRRITYHIERLACPDNGALFPVSICWLCLCRCLDWWRCSRLEIHWSADRREASGDRSLPVRLCPTAPGLLLCCQPQLSMCNCRIWNDYLKLKHGSISQK